MLTTMNMIAGITHSEIEKLSKSSPCLQYTFFSESENLFQYNKGLAEISSCKEAGKHTMFHFFSNTKTFTAVAVLQLIEKGFFKLKTPVFKIIDNFPYGNTITVQHLLCHSSGIPNPIPLSWIHLASVDAEFDHEQFYSRVVEENKKVRFAPNAKYAYSNVEYMVLARIIEVTSGMDYRTYVRENIFTPCGATDNELTFSVNEEQMARGYHKKYSFSNMLLGIFIDKQKFMKRSSGKWKPFEYFNMNGSGHTGVIGTLSGARKYLQALLKKDSPLLSEESLHLMLRENILENGKPSGLTLSWFKGDIHGNSYYAHAGGGGGYYSEFRIYPEAGCASVLLMNRSGMKDERLLDRLDKQLLKNKIHGN